MKFILQTPGAHRRCRCKYASSTTRGGQYSDAPYFTCPPLSYERPPRENYRTYSQLNYDQTPCATPGTVQIFQFYSLLPRKARKRGVIRSVFFFFIHLRRRVKRIGATFVSPAACWIAMTRRGPSWKRVGRPWAIVSKCVAARRAAGEPHHHALFTVQ